MINFFAQYMPILDFRTLLYHWQAAGIFDIVLPFLLIFAVVFAILEKGHILGDNKAIHAIVSLAVGFFAISNPWLTPFFAILFSNAALGFAVILVIVLFLGFFIKEKTETWWVWIGAIAAGVIFFWVLGRSIRDSGLHPVVYQFFYENPYLWSVIIYGVPIALIILAIVLSSSKGKETQIKIPKG